MKRVLTAAITSLFILTGVASAQTTPAASSETGRLTVSAEALLWWFKDNPTPPLVTNGLLGQPGTKVYLGGRDEDTGANPGFRLGWSYGLTEQWGLESSVFYVPTRTTSRSVSSSGLPGSENLSVPIVDATTGRESLSGVSVQGLFSGRAQEQLSNSLLGAELNGTMRLAIGSAWRVDMLGGLRYLRLRETYTFFTSSPNLPPRPADVYDTTDIFDATNNFFGAQLGLRARGDWGSWFATGVAKVALGAMRQTVDIEGTLISNDFNGFGAPVAYPGGGYFATPTNIGQRTRTVFTVVPEANLTLGYRLTPAVSIVAGYTFLYANDVVRAPNQINRTVNYSDGAPARPNGPQEPSFKFKSSDFWAQGLNLGIAVRF